ncbi:MAG TPA: hypothetical protein VF802_04190 [Candidatus Limnocylindrales bacterium]
MTSDGRIVLRHLRDEGGTRHLEAYLDEEGALHVDGHDFGRGTAVVSSDGEYEWYKTIAAPDVPQLTALLGAAPGEGILAVLERAYTGERAADFERVLRESGIPVELFVC